MAACLISLLQLDPESEDEDDRIRATVAGLRLSEAIHELYLIRKILERQNGR
jgi:hypothetical protein